VDLGNAQYEGHAHRFPCRACAHGVPIVFSCSFSMGMSTSKPHTNALSQSCLAAAEPSAGAAAGRTAIFRSSKLGKPVDPCASQNPWASKVVIAAPNEQDGQELAERSTPGTGQTQPSNLAAPQDAAAIVARRGVV